jgi:hypothetical protein
MGIKITAQVLSDIDLTSSMPVLIQLYFSYFLCLKMGRESEI